MTTVAKKRPATEYVSFADALKEDDRMTKKQSAKKKASAKVAPVKRTTSRKVSRQKVENPDKPESKMDIAIRIFAKEFNRKTRKEIIQLFMTEAGLTKAGSSTYYQTLKKAHEGN